jgi:hypothetical protein
VPPNCADALDNDRDGSIDSADSDCAAASPNPNGESTPLGAWNEAADVAHSQLHASLVVSGGGGSQADLDPGLESADDVTNFSAAFQLGDVTHLTPGREDDWVTIIGNNNALAGDPGKAYNLQFNLRAWYRGAYQEGNTHLGGLTLNLNNNFEVPYVPIDLYGGYTLNGSDWLAQNRYYYDGTNNQLVAGLALNPYLGTDKVALRLFGEYRHGWFTWADTLPTGDFSGEENQVRVGGELTIDVSNMSTSKWAPQLILSGSCSPWMTTAIPMIRSGLDSHFDERALAWDTGLTLNFADSPVNLFLMANYGELNREFWDTQRTFSSSLGLDYPMVGGFRLDGGYIQNPALFYGSDQGYAALTYTFAPEWFRGAGAFSVTGRYDNIDGQNLGSAFLNLDLIELFVPSSLIPPPVEQ